MVEPDVERALLGTVHGEDALPDRWRRDVELADVALDIADRLADGAG